jgi:hypothetical protein
MKLDCYIPELQKLADDYGFFLHHIENRFVFTKTLKNSKAIDDVLKKNAERLNLTFNEGSPFTVAIAIEEEPDGPREQYRIVFGIFDPDVSPLSVEPYYWYARAAFAEYYQHSKREFCSAETFALFVAKCYMEPSQIDELTKKALEPISEYNMECFQMDNVDVNCHLNELGKNAASLLPHNYIFPSRFSFPTLGQLKTWIAHGFFLPAATYAQTYILNSSNKALKEGLEDVIRDHLYSKEAKKSSNVKEIWQERLQAYISRGSKAC